MLREFKMNIVVMDGNGQTLDSASVEPAAADYLEIPVYTIDKKKEKRKKIKNPTRAMRKQELKRLIEEEREEIDF